MEFDINTIINGLTLGAVTWGFGSINKLLTTTVMHEWRISALEKKKNQPNENGA
jgi:hypothetical protein